MDVVTGALSSLLSKLGDLLKGEYTLQKGVKGEIKFLQTELKSMHDALEEIAAAPADQLHNNDRIWARQVRELSYDTEDSIDTFMVRGQGSEPAESHGYFKWIIERCCDLLAQFNIRREIAIEFRDIKRRVIEVRELRDRYKNDSVRAKPITATVDPLSLGRYRKVTELVGIEEATDEVIKILIEGDEVSKQQYKIVSIVGFGGLGKTTLANVVYKKLRAQFDCSAFVSVSHTPDMEKLFKGMLHQLDEDKYSSFKKETWDERQLIHELRELLEEKRYFIVIDDIWDISVWKMIRYVLPNNNAGYKIITTTRILSVAEQAGGSYKLKPLSIPNSRKLFYGRIFGSENNDNNEDRDKCPDEQLAEVSDKILKKCAGVPLAILAIASLLASKGKNKMEWYEVYYTIGTGLEDSFDWENMRKILSFSYYDMPSHLRTCLLYLSVFPEDFEIEKKRLIWMWIAEGFIQCKKQGKGLFELGESYFNELIDRSMIEPVYNEYWSMIHNCRVHDMVLDLIRSLSSEENFVTVSGDTDRSSLSNTVRRLSLQNGNADHDTTRANGSNQQVRSVVVFSSAINLIQTLSSFRVLRVLDLNCCDLSQGFSFKYLGNLLHLRYLGLERTHITQLPEEIGNLRYLQTLDVWGNAISSLPSTVTQLSRLMNLRIGSTTGVPNGIRSLTSLEQLSLLHIDGRTNIIEELGHLTELRVLEIDFSGDWSKLLECLRKLQKIQNLWINSDYESNIGGLDDWVGPRHLRTLRTGFSCWFSTLPAWIDPSKLLDLSSLSIAVRELRQEDLETLGRLPALRCLDLWVDHVDLGIHGRFVVGARWFPCLVHCMFRGLVRPVVFQQGAMPRLTRLDFDFHVRETREIAGSDGGFNLGLGNLPSLQEVKVLFRSRGASKGVVKEAKAGLRHAAEIHPNHPTLTIYQS